MEMASDVFHMVMMRTMMMLMMMEAMTTMMEEPGSGLVLALFPPSVTIHPPSYCPLSIASPQIPPYFYRIYIYLHLDLLSCLNSVYPPC